MAPSTHSADVSQIQTDTTAILLDTGTTIPATIATLDTNVDAVLVDTGTTIPATMLAELPNRILIGENVSTAVSASSATPVDGLNFTADLPAGDYEVEACVVAGTEGIPALTQVALYVGGTLVSYWRKTPTVSSDQDAIVLRGGGLSDGDNVTLKVYNYTGTGPSVMQKQTIYAIKLRS